jgi:protein ImuB
MWWLALHLPWLPLEALAPEDDAACCVIEQRSVLVATRAARAAGVEPGMSASTAASLAPQVAQRVRDPEREAAFVRLLALAVSRFTPQVVLQPDGVLLEVSASLRLFGGHRALLRELRATVRACGAHARLAAAPSATGAALLARMPGPPARALQPERLGRLLDALPLPAALAVLQQPPRLAELLQAVGATRLADVRALPRAGLKKRGAAALLQALDRAYGETPDPQAWFEPPPQFALGLELAHRADDAAQLVFAGQRLVQALAGWLTARWLAASRLVLKLRHERGRRSAPDGTLLVELGAPSRDAAQIGLLLRERLQRHVLPAPVYAIELVLDEAVSSAGSAGHLLPDPAAQAQEFHALLDRLASRLGRERVRRLAVQDGHRPERAGVARPVADALPSVGAAPAGATPRPAWLLPAPIKLVERDGHPVHGCPLALLSRAERIESGWFDGALVCRDYHVAEGSDHRLRWIFRVREPGGEMAWYLHGLFG